MSTRIQSFAIALLICGQTYSIAPASAEQVTKAIAVLLPTETHTARGQVSFEKVADGVEIRASLTGLKPGKHGFHIHQYGDCLAKDAMSAGEHFASVGETHAAPDNAKRHLGDLGNITADQLGNVELITRDERISLTGADAILGRSVVVHEAADDLTSQPAGAAGARIACGVIGVVSPSR